MHRRSHDARRDFHGTLQRLTGLTGDVGGQPPPALHGRPGQNGPCGVGRQMVTLQHESSGQCRKPTRIHYGHRPTIADSVRTNLPRGAVVDVRPAAEVADAASYDAIVLGSAVYMGRWMEEARQAATRIASQPPSLVWLFSSGPIGDPPNPHEEPAEVHEIVTATGARGHRLFAGRLDRHKLGIAEKAMVLALRVGDGDYRDWDAIDTWGRQIASELCSSTAQATP